MKILPVTKYYFMITVMSPIFSPSQQGRMNPLPALIVQWQICFLPLFLQIIVDFGRSNSAADDISLALHVISQSVFT